MWLPDPWLDSLDPYTPGFRLNSGLSVNLPSQALHPIHTPTCIYLYLSTWSRDLMSSLQPPFVSVTFLPPSLFLRRYNVRKITSIPLIPSLFVCPTMATIHRGNGRSWEINQFGQFIKTWFRDRIIYSRLLKITLWFFLVNSNESNTSVYFSFFFLQEKRLFIHCPWFSKTITQIPVTFMEQIHIPYRLDGARVDISFLSLVQASLCSSPEDFLFAAVYSFFVPLTRTCPFSIEDLDALGARSYL